MHAAGFFADDLLSHHFDGAVESFEVYDAYQSIYPKAFVNLAEGCLPRMDDGQGKLVCVSYPGWNHMPTPKPRPSPYPTPTPNQVSNPGCNHMQTPRVGYDMPGQGKATMADSNLYP